MTPVLFTSHDTRKICLLPAVTYVLTYGKTYVTAFQLHRAVCADLPIRGLFPGQPAQIYPQACAYLPSGSVFQRSADFLPSLRPMVASALSLLLVALPGALEPV